MEKKKLNFILQISLIVVFAFVALGSGTTNKASQKRVDASNAAAQALRSYGYKDNCIDDIGRLRYLGFKIGNCKATIIMHFRGDDRNSEVLVVFQYCEASSSLKDKINNIANCKYIYDSSDYDYCSSRGGTSTTPPSSSSYSDDCSLNHWVERRGDSYVPYFQKSGNCGLSLDYSIYSVSSGQLLYNGHLYFTKSEYGSPSTGYSYKENIRIVITSKKWD